MIVTDSTFVFSEKNEYKSRDICSMELSELKTYLSEEMGEKPFRGQQIFQWIHKRLASDFSEMDNIPLSLRDKLKEGSSIPEVSIIKKLESNDKKAVKYLFRFEDGNVIESVLMRYDYGNSVCVSSQVGCRMGCSFCASTIDGLVRNLSPYEILSQVYGIIRDTKERVSHVVIMGSGEPMDNYDNVIRFIRLLTHKEGQDISARNITLSTCGVVPGMDELGKEGLPVTLAVSLHGPDDITRERLVPLTKKYHVRDIVSAADRYFEKTGRRVTYEYSLVDGVNDSDECCMKLSGLLRGKNCHVNLISMNPVKERKWRPGKASRVLEFKNKLEKNGIHVTIRASVGRDIDAACGQLRKSYLDGRSSE